MWKCVDIDRVCFCKDCHSILNLPNRDNKLTCPYCDFSVDAKNIDKADRKPTRGENTTNDMAVGKTRQISTILEMEKELKKQLRGQLSGTSLKMIDEECPKCHAPRMAYTERQLRSVDEGQSIFYQCLKCGHKHILHS